MTGILILKVGILEHLGLTSSMFSDSVPGAW